jgi:hypothetical protein
MAISTPKLEGAIPFMIDDVRFSDESEYALEFIYAHNILRKVVMRSS